MWVGHLFLMSEDPAPVPPAAYGTAAFWRWLSRRTLARRHA